jgi:hypothetical protein
VDVRGVTGQEERPRSVPRGASVVQPEVSHPHRLAQRELVAGVGIGDGLQLRQIHPASVVGHGRGTHGQHPPGGGSAQREEEQHPRLGHVRVGGTCLQPVDLQIGQEERLRICGAGERYAGVLPDGAVGAVAADDVAGANGLGPSVAVS